MSSVDKLLAIMATLRDPEKGCPWDIKQTFASIAPYTIEEAYEVADAIQHGDPAALCDELGDLLLNVVFHAQMAKEAGEFTFDDVVTAICDKMVRCHPHVFAAPGNPQRTDDAHLHSAWEQQKAKERHAQSPQQTLSILDGIALALPALMRAQKLGKRAASVGFDWQSIAAVNEKIREELVECEEVIDGPKARIEEEIGDLLFAVVNLARHTNVDAEQALRKGNEKFKGRFTLVETAASQAGEDLTACDAEQLDQFWRAAKQTYQQKQP